MTGRRRDSRRSWRRSRHAISVLVLAGGLIFLFAGTAQAHAVLVSSSPEDGATLPAAPAVVSLTFDEPISVIAGIDEVISTTGVRVDTGGARLSADRTTLLLDLREGVPRGTYSASYRIVSADTHVVSGSITFGVGQAPSGEVPLPPDRTGALGVADQVCTGLLYLGLILLLGAVGVAWWLWPALFTGRRVRWMAWAGWAASITGTVGALLIQGPRADDTGWSGLVRLVGLEDTVTSAYGIDLLARLVLLLLALPLLGSPRPARPDENGTGGPRLRQVVAIALGAALVISTVINGHQATGGQAVLAMLAAALHVAAMALWIGGLAVLALVALPAARRDHEPLSWNPMGRWSLLAYGCVTVLILTGEYQASRQIDPLPSLWTTRYGLLLLLKVLLVAAAAAAAGFGHRWSRRIAVRSTEPAAVVRGLRRTVAVEIAFTIAVLAVTSILVSEPPARATYNPPVTVSADLDGRTHLRIDIDSTRRGAQHITVQALDSAGNGVTVRSVTGVLASAQIPSLTVRFVPDGSVGAAAGRWRSAAAVVPVSGIWTLSLTVGVNTADDYISSVHYQVW